MKRIQLQPPLSQPDEGSDEEASTPARRTITRSDGTVLEVAQLASDRPLIMMFTLEGCFACRLFSRRLSRWRRRAGTAADVVVAYRGSSANAARELSKENPLLLDTAPGDLLPRLGVSVYPCVVLLETGAATASAPLYDQADVDRVVDELRRLSTHAAL